MYTVRQQAEINVFENLITKIYPKGLVSIVSDTFDFYFMIAEGAKILKSVIMGRDGKVVFRPDTGDPVDIICGNAPDITELAKGWLDEYFTDTSDDDFLHEATVYANEHLMKAFKWRGNYYEQKEVHDESDWVKAENPTPEMKGAVECLWEIFGGTTTDKGFKTLDSHVGLIYGDSINLDRAQRILEGLKAKGFSSANIVFGIGSFTYQFVTRDTMGEAVKATFGIVNNEEREIYKDPKTGDGVKKSAKGLLRVEYDPSTKDYTLYDQQTWDQEEQGELKVLFQNSQMMRIDSLDNIRTLLYNSI